MSDIAPVEAPTVPLVTVLPDVGIVAGIPEDEYHALPRLSQSSIKTLLRSPAHYKGQERKESKEMKQGSLIDIALTEPARLDTDYHVVPAGFRMDPRTKAYQAEEALAAGRIMVKQPDFDKAQAIRDAVQSHLIASQLLEGAQAQLAAFWQEETEHGLVKMKGRMDWVNPGMRILIDLKSTDDARSFPKKAGDLGYFIQDAAYRRGWEMAGGFAVDAFVFIVVERDPPHGIKLYELSQKARDKGLQQYLKGVNRYAQCVATDNWFTYDPHIVEVDVPEYTLRKYEDDE